MNNSTEQYYKEKAQEFFDRTKDINLESIYEPFLKLLPKEAKILDVGSGSGRDTYNFEREGYDVWPIEPSVELAELGRDHFGIMSVPLRVQELTVEDLFDGIWCSASLLHIPKEEMISVIEILEKALKENGILYLSFKKGTTERYYKERFYNDYTFETFYHEVLQHFPNLQCNHFWYNEDLHPNLKEKLPPHLNMILQKE